MPMFKQQLSVQQWLDIPIQLRMKMAKAFELHRSGFTVVENNVVKSDGYNYNDLAVITPIKLQEFLETDEQDFVTLLKLTLGKLSQPEPIQEPAEAPFKTLEKDEIALFRKEYEERQLLKKQKENEQKEQQKTTASEQDQTATSRRGRPKKGSGTNEGGSQGDTVPNTQGELS